MEKIKRYFVINEFEDGWDISELSYDEVIYEYCIDVLFIPEENIEETQLHSDGLEITLHNLQADDLSEDWFTNLKRISIDMGEA